MYSIIAGCGHYAPETIVGSAALERKLSLTEGWIERRTGVRERRYATADQAVTDLAYEASAAAIEDAKIPSSEISLVLLATSTPDHLLPPSAPLLAYRLGCGRAGAMDLAGACTGFVYALALADSYVRVHGKPVLVVAANILSRRINPGEKTSSILFGDAAGAVVLRPGKNENGGVLAVHLSSQGAHYDLIKIEAGGSRTPFTSDTTMANRTIRLSNGTAAFAIAVESMVETSRTVLAAAKMSIEDVDWWIPHQANRRIIEAARQRLGMPENKVLYSLQKFGNSSAATIPFTLSLHRKDNRLQPGNILMMTAVGAGFTEGAVISRL